MKKNKKGFTLAETLIALVILGVVAAITIPALIQKYMEATNRTKVKKAMAAYEKAIGQMVVENGNTAISSWADGIVNNCANTTIFFKKIQGEGCRFKTSDGVWWDISNIEHPIIAFNEEDLDDENATNRFELFAHNEDGILRVNDKADELLSEDERISLEKLYEFVNNNSGGVETPKTNTDKLSDCTTNSAATCTITYDCPTQEEPTKTCELEMIKRTFDTSNCDTSSLAGPSNSCPEKPTNYIVIPESENGKTWNEISCPDGTRMAKAGELAQLWNNVTEGDVLSTSCYECWFFAQDENSVYGNLKVYTFSPYHGAFYNSYKNASNDTTRVVCVGN